MNPFEPGTEEHGIWDRQETGVLDRVHAYLGRFVAYPSDHAHVAHTLWVAHTHLMDAWESTPRIAFLSPEPGSGKTRALEAMEPLVPRPVEAVNVTPAYLFRKVGDKDGAPTILYDEIDTVFGPKAKDNEEIRGLLNAGHRRGAVAGRCVVRGKMIETEEIPAYCAVALAGLGNLPDTILTRSVVIKMRRRSPDERVEPYRPRVHRAEAAELYEALEMWAAGAMEKVGDPWPDLPDTITDRNADVWEPLIAIADVAGGDWPDRARVAAVALVADLRDGGHSVGIQLLRDLLKVFGDQTAMFSFDVLTALAQVDEAPWNTYNKGYPLDSRDLSKLLSQYDIGPKDVRINGVVRKGYSRSDLTDSWNRYLPPPPPSCEGMGKEHVNATDATWVSPAKSATSATSATDSATGATEPVAAATSDLCCRGSDISPSCRLCPSSPTYWRHS